MKPWDPGLSLSRSNFGGPLRDETEPLWLVPFEPGHWDCEMEFLELGGTVGSVGESIREIIEVPGGPGDDARLRFLGSGGRSGVE